MKRTRLSSLIASAALCAGGAGSASAALLTFTATGSTNTDAGLTAAVGSFRTAISGGGGNNGVAGGPFTNGRREINWDAAGLDASAVPGTMPGNFFNNNSRRGAVFTPGAGGSLIVSGRPASGSTDLRFSSLQASYAADFQTFSADRLFGITGSSSLTTSFFVPNQPTQAATVSGFGAIFQDVDLGGSVIEAFDLSNTLIGSVTVPSLNNGLSFAGLYFDGGERIGSIRITAGTAGLGALDNPGGGVDMVAMDDFFYSEPQAVPEPGAASLGVLAALGLLRRRRR